MSSEDDLKAQTRQVLDEELAWLGIQRPLPGAAQDGPAALCLSGGGIRSATFSLGVLQSLAQKGMLDRFHYLSTVSGGGYIGSWLSAWIARCGQAEVVRQLAADKATEEPIPVKRLRSYTSYLAPVWGLSTDFLSLVATFLRNLALNWLVLVPLIVAALMLPRLQLAMISARGMGDGVYYILLGLAALLVAVTVGYVAADVPHVVPEKPPKNRFALCCFVPLLAAAVILSWLVAWDPKKITQSPLRDVLGYSGYAQAAMFAGAIVQLVAMCIGRVWRRARRLAPLTKVVADTIISVAVGAAAGWLLFQLVSWVGPKLKGPEDLALYATVGVPLLLMVFWAGCTAYTAGTSSFKPEDEREWWARASAWWFGAGIVWLAGAVLVIYLPPWLLSLPILQGPSAPATAGAGAALLGVVTSAVGYWSKNGGKIRKHTETILEATGLRLLDLLSVVFVAALLVAMSIGVSFALQAQSGTLEQAVLQQQGGAGHTAARAGIAYAVVLERASPLILAAGILALATLGVLLSWAVKVNTFSLHSMYGNRLARAYLGASNLNRRPHWFTGFDPDDTPKLTDGSVRKPGEPHRLLHVVNVALNLVKPAGDRLEWQQRMAASFTMSPLQCGSAVLGYVKTADYGSKKGGMSWARAMAISGAAASPNMGYHTSKVVAFVMTFFNVRLGWWSPNPMPEHRSSWPDREPLFAVRPLLDEALASASAKRAFVYLSDGGHFENLGLYEMVRRRCTRILVVDGGCDPKDEFEDLEGAVRKVRVDFGATIEFDEPLPTSENANTRKRHIAVGKIHYADGLIGELVYLKAVLTGEEPLDVLRFAAANNKKGKAFPHQPTADQFFNESQFESYRMLGKHSVERHFTDWATWPVKQEEPKKSVDDNTMAFDTIPAQIKPEGWAAILTLAQRYVGVAQADKK